jgi:hypothetical protein
VLMRTSKDAGRPARPPSGWARAREWLGRLLGRSSPPVPDDDAPPVAARRPAAASPGTAAEPAEADGNPVARLTADELARVRRDLRKVLDQHAESRRVMRYLRALEHGLHKKGRHALEVLPAELLRRALGQLDLLVTDRSLPGLATLRSKAAISIAEREREVTGYFERPTSSQPGLSQGEVVIEDISHDAFLEANEEWERSFTGQHLTLPLDLDPLPTTDAEKSGTGNGPGKRAG